MIPPAYPVYAAGAAALEDTEGEDAIALLEAGAETGGVGDFSERLVRRFLMLCESPRTRQGMLAMVRGSVGSARAGRRFYAVLNRTVVNPAARATGMHASALRIELVSGQLVGLAMMRYVLKLEPVASAEVDQIVAQFAPAIRATLRGA